MQALINSTTVFFSDTKYIKKFLFRSKSINFILSRKKLLTLTSNSINTQLPIPPQGRAAAIAMPVRAYQVNVESRELRQWRHQNVPGDFFVGMFGSTTRCQYYAQFVFFSQIKLIVVICVDHRCIDCGACPWQAPVCTLVFFIL